MNMSVKDPDRQSQGGVVLIEVMISILIFAIGVLAVVGLQAGAIANVADSKYRLEASAAADQQIARMWIDQPNFAAHAGTVAVPELPNGSMVTAVTPRVSLTGAVVGAEVVIDVTWQPPNAAASHRFSTTTTVYGS
jgi:type IV pilus assembly protein PilV